MEYLNNAELVPFIVKIKLYVSKNLKPFSNHHQMHAFYFFLSPALVTTIKLPLRRTLVRSANNSSDKMHNKKFKHNTSIHT